MCECHAYIPAMERKQRTMTAVVVLITAALAGMVWVQIILLQKAFALARQAHAQNVNAALRSIVNKLEERETVTRMFSALVQPAPVNRVFAVHAHVEKDSLIVTDSTEAWRRPLPPPVRFDPHTRKFSFTLDAPKRVRLRILDSLGRPIQALVDDMKPAGTYNFALDSTQAPAGNFFYTFNTGADSATYDVVFMGATRQDGHARWFTNERREKIIDQVLDELTLIQREPLEERIQPAALDSIVRTVMAEQGLHLTCTYGILDRSGPRDSLKYVTPAHARARLEATPFRARLFPGDPLYPPHELLLHFPEQNIFLLKQNGWLLASVCVLLSLIAFCFVYTLRKLLQQKQFAQRLTQFINNMTHEFKTPIATITLASEALKSPQVLSHRGRTQRYGGVIFDEAQRMRGQVEKILQMAVLEEGEYELNLSQIDVHQISSEVIRSFAVQVEKRQGEIVREFCAAPALIEADAVHFANIIHNLLDNANKYTPAKPRIVVSTTSDEHGVHLKIADNGIGLRPEEKKLVFHKYYRVSTGNLHDVKGFGLGLSYVKLMVEAHGGRIEVESAYQCGSVFQIFMPYRVRPKNQRHARA